MFGIAVIFGLLLVYNVAKDDESFGSFDSFDIEESALPTDIVTVHGIRVSVDIADDIDALMTEAKASNIDLDGFGFRTNDQQVELRKRHCGETDFDIYEKSPSQCDPPTARPGSSRHERGLAIDFRYEGRIIRERSSAGFRWLAENAAEFGLKNLPSEPWHWSVDGR